MAIEFACPECARGYSVKDELAGKSAKCGQCGHKMKIPVTPVKARAAAAQPPAPKSAAIKSTATKAAVVKPVAAAAHPTKSSKPIIRPAAKAASAKPPIGKSPPADEGLSSWLDEELESSRADIKTKPQPSPSAAANQCPSCEAPLAEGAVLCVKCGYDTRTRGRRTLQHVEADDVSSKPSKLAGAASLLRGTFFSFLFAMIGAIIWAVLAYLTWYEFSIVAWGLGGLAGLGMALGHDSDDGTFPGIIAAFMSLVGIVAAKVFIVVIFVAAAVSAAVGELEEQIGADPVEMQRSALAMALAMKDLEASGESMASVDVARFEAAVEKQRGLVADLTPEQIEARLNELGEEQGLEGDVEDFDEDAEIADEEAVPDDEEEASALADEEVTFDDEEDASDDATFGSVVGSLFGPMDAIFILFAFFTAYKVGSGELGD